MIDLCRSSINDLIDLLINGSSKLVLNTSERILGRNPVRLWIFGLIRFNSHHLAQLKTNPIKFKCTGTWPSLFIKKSPKPRRFPNWKYISLFFLAVCITYHLSPTVPLQILFIHAGKPHTAASRRISTPDLSTR